MPACLPSLSHSGVPDVMTHFIEVEPGLPVLVMEDIESKNIKHPSRTPTLSLDFEGKQLQVSDVDWRLFLGAMFDSDVDSDSGNLIYQLEKQECSF